MFTIRRMLLAVLDRLIDDLVRVRMRTLRDMDYTQWYDETMDYEFDEFGEIILPF